MSPGPFNDVRGSIASAKATATRLGNALLSVHLTDSERALIQMKRAEARAQAARLTRMLQRELSQLSAEVSP